MVLVPANSFDYASIYENILAISNNKFTYFIFTFLLTYNPESRDHFQYSKPIFLLSLPIFTNYLISQHTQDLFLILLPPVYPQ